MGEESAAATRSARARLGIGDLSVCTAPGRAGARWVRRRRSLRAARGRVKDRDALWEPIAPGPAAGGQSSPSAGGPALSGRGANGSPAASSARSVPRATARRFEEFAMNRVASCGLVALLCLATAARAELHLALSDCGGVDHADWSCASDSGTAFVVVGLGGCAGSSSRWSGRSPRSLSTSTNPCRRGGRWVPGRCRPTEAVVVGFDGGPYSCYRLLRLDPGWPDRSRAPTRSGPTPQSGTRTARSRTIAFASARCPQSISTPPCTRPSRHLGTELFLYSITVRRQRTTGADACAGCGACVRCVSST